MIFASRAEAARLRSEISELFGAALEPEAVSGWPDMLNYDHFEPYLEGIGNLQKNIYIYSKRLRIGVMNYTKGEKIFANLYY